MRFSAEDRTSKVIYTEQANERADVAQHSSRQFYPWCIDKCDSWNDWLMIANDEWKQLMSEETRQRFMRRWYGFMIAWWMKVLMSIETLKVISYWWTSTHVYEKEISVDLRWSFFKKSLINNGRVRTSFTNHENHDLFRQCEHDQCLFMIFHTSDILLCYVKNMLKHCSAYMSFQGLSRQMKYNKAMYLCF